MQTGGPATIYTVDPAVQVTLAADKGVDSRYLEGWNRYAIAVVVNALAANFSRTRIRNPPGSGIIAVLEQISYSPGTGADTPIIAYGATVTDLATLSTLTFSRMDPRGNPQPTCIVSGNAQAAGGIPNLQRSVSSGATTDFITNPDQEIPLLSGQVIDVQSNVANTQSIVTFMWRERVLEQSELA